ncbi:T9SS type A sorting domain-containing protein [Flavobacterium sp. LaA7.5]|nr:T9SS type A sorting domain-containing protein [Flavobacterium salilacus subsp. altitudinum]
MNKIYLNQHGRGRFLLTLLTILFYAGLNAQNWEYIGSSSGISASGAGSVSTGLDQDGNIYVSYYDTSVSKGTVQQYSGGAWSYVGGTAGITEGFANYNSFSVHSSGNLYFTNQNNGMQVRQFDGSSWNLLTPATTNAINYQTSAVTGGNMLLVANGENSGTVKRYSGGTWEQVGATGFTAGVPFFMDAVIDSNDKMYISFSNNGYVHVYENDVTAGSSTAWTPTGGEANIAPASSSENYKSAIAIDSDDNLYLAYVSNTAGGQKLNVKKYDGTSWTQLGAANFTTGRVQHVSIAVSSDGTPYVAVSNWEDADFLKNYVVGYNEAEDTWEQIGDGYISAGQATYNSLQVDSDNNLLLAFADSNVGKLVMMTYDLDTSEETPETTINPVTITSGFNHDIIANGIGNASTSSDIGFDEVNSRALVSLDFQPTSGSGFPTYGLPTNGLITSAITSDVTFQLADYSGDNALFLTPNYVGTGTSTGTLELSVENATNLYLLTATAGGGVQYLPLNVTINFDDNTTQDATISVSDWYSGTSAAIQGIGRVNRANNNLEGNATDPRLYEYTIAVDAANQNKTITSIDFSFDGQQTAEYGNEIRLSLLAVSAQNTSSNQSLECVFTPLSLTGFNHDVVAEGTGGNANEKASHPIDGANAFFAQDFVPTNPHASGASAAAYGGGLPNDGYIDSSATEGLMYQVADYTTNNALVLRNSTTNTGTLELTEQKKAEKLYIAWVSAEGSNSVDVAVNFADGSSQTFTSQNASDWWSTNPNATTVAMGSIGRVSVITTAPWAPVNSFSGLTQTQLFQTEFILDEENHNKLIESVTFNKETSSNNATTTAVIALSICETQGETQINPETLAINTLNDVPAEITTNGGTLQLEAAVSPEGASQAVVWSVTEGSDFATVDENGLVTATGNGAVTVTATSTIDDTISNTITITISGQEISYCTPVFTSNLGCGNYRLRNVSIGDIENDATAASCLTSDYLSLNTTHELGETVNFSITLGNWMSFAIYADFNADGDFDDEGEMLFAGNPAWVTAVETVTNSFVLPSDITPGNYRMRVVAVWGDNSDNPPVTEGQACDTFNREGSGNFHDYTLTIIEQQNNVAVNTQGSVPAEITVDNGTLQLVATVTPVAQDVTWTIVSGNEYATVDANGVVTATDNGTVTVRAALAGDATIYDEIEITISNQTVAVTGITVTVQDNAPAEIITNGGTLQLIATITPEDATNTDVTWSITSGSEYATVDENGVVTAIANGTVTVRATSDADSTIYDEIDVVISNQTVAVTSITVTVQDNAPAEITTENGTLQLIATITPEDATNTDVTWSITSGGEYATVDENGVVTAIANGTVTVRATSDADGTIYAEIEIVINIPLSTADFEKSNFTIYPNPVFDVVNIQTSREIQEVKLYNIVGQEVYTGTSSVINLHNFQAGYYVVQVSFKNGNVSSVKIIKQ